VSGAVVSVGEFIKAGVAEFIVWCGEELLD